MTVQKIALFSLLGAGVVGGSAASIYHFSKDKTTIKDHLIEKETKLISDPEEYEIAFLELKSKDDFKTTIGNIQDGTTLQQGGEALKNWCEENLKLELTNKEAKDKLPKVEDYCSKPSLDIQSRIKRGDKKLIATGEWPNKYAKLKEQPSSDSSLDTDINVAAIKTGDTNDKGGQALKAWCEKTIKTKLVEDKDEKNWKLVEKRCLH